MFDGGRDKAAVRSAATDAVQWRGLLSESHGEDCHSQTQHSQLPRRPRHGRRAGIYIHVYIHMYMYMYANVNIALKYIHVLYQYFIFMYDGIYILCIHVCMYIYLSSVETLTTEKYIPKKVHVHVHVHVYTHHVLVHIFFL